LPLQRLKKDGPMVPTSKDPPKTIILLTGCRPDLGCFGSNFAPAVELDNHRLVVVASNPGQANADLITSHKSYRLVDSFGTSVSS
jgi:hypothetical protein